MHSCHHRSCFLDRAPLSPTTTIHSWPVVDIYISYAVIIYFISNVAAIGMAQNDHKWTRTIRFRKLYYARKQR